MPLAIDTLDIYRRLKSTGLAEESAREITEIFRETVEENLASKNDLKTTESNLTKDIKTIESNLTKDIKTIESNLTKYIKTIESNLTKYIKTIESNLTKDIESIRNELKKDIAESKADTIKWVAGMLVAQAALIATLVKLL